MTVAPAIVAKRARLARLAAEMAASMKTQRTAPVRRPRGASGSPIKRSA